MNPGGGEGGSVGQQQYLVPPSRAGDAWASIEVQGNRRHVCLRHTCLCLSLEDRFREVRRKRAKVFLVGPIFGLVPTLALHHPEAAMNQHPAHCAERHSKQPPGSSHRRSPLTHRRNTKSCLLSTTKVEIKSFSVDDTDHFVASPSHSCQVGSSVTEDVSQPPS